MDYTYSYLILGLIFLIPWTVLYYLRRDVRKEMLIFSVLFGVAGLIVEKAYIADWWRPLTITGTLIGIEDFIFGFVIGGIASVIYEEIWKKRIRIRKANQKRKNIKLLMGVSIFWAIFFSSHYLIGLNTLISSVLAFSYGITEIWIKRKDLIIDSIASGILLLIVAIGVYSIMEIITPGWVSEFWYFKNVPYIFIFNVPLDDFIWYFLAGAYIGPLYEYSQEGKIAKYREYYNKYDKSNEE